MLHVHVEVPEKAESGCVEEVTYKLKEGHITSYRIPIHYSDYNEPPLGTLYNAKQTQKDIINNHIQGIDKISIYGTHTFVEISGRGQSVQSYNVA